MKWFLIISLFISLDLIAQSPDIEELLEQNVEMESGDPEELLEQYQHYLEQPLNLNLASEEQLRHLRLLTEQQLCELLAYRKRYGYFLSMYELQAVKFFDIETIYKIIPYVTVERQLKSPPSMQRMINNGRNTLMIRYSRILEDSEAYQKSSYFGNADRIYARYKFNYSDKLSFGITAEKDPGEAFFKAPQKYGFDFYSAHFFYKPNKLIQSVVLGDYEVKAGQGLIIWNGFGYGKVSDPLYVRKTANILKPYTSVDENRFLRGTAATFKFNNIYLTPFFSSKTIDATVSATEDKGYTTEVSTLLITGLHRTASELSNKNSIIQTVGGAHLKYRFSKIDVGLTVTYASLSADLQPKDAAYNYFRFSGKEALNAGFDYTYVNKGRLFFGETAISSNGGVATLNGFTTKLDLKNTVTILHRYYHKKYHTFFGNSFSESSGINNENGLFISLNSSISKKVRFQGYVDLFKHPWLKYLIDAPSSGADYSGRLIFTPNRKTEIFAQVRWEQKQQNESDNTTPVDHLISHIKKGIRINVAHQPQPRVQLKSRAEYNYYTDENGADERGFLIYQDVSYQFLKIPFKISMRYTLFDTDSWNTRIYAYENDVLYAFSVPAYNDEGARYYLLANYKINRNIEFWGKIAQFYYPQKEVIGTGKEAIEGNRKTDLKLQMRLRV